MDLKETLDKITDEYSAKILNWAIRKTGSRQEGENLAQEVFLQVFIAFSKQIKIEKPENFIWKIARYTWCNHVRALVRHNACELSEALPDNTDFAQELAENEALQTELSHMRRKIADLSRLQREVIILHYLDNLSVRETAARLEITETAAAWHLFDARKKIKKELEVMKYEIIKNEEAHIYYPGKMRVTASGDMPQNPDTEKINSSLIRQNLCLLCRENGKTIDELVKLTGVSRPYLEYDLDWLVEHEFLLHDNGRYMTSFIIMNQRYFEYRREIFFKNKNNFINKIIEYLWQKESEIREIGFYGKDFPADRLMWAVITMFISYASRNSELLLRLKNRDDCEIQSDGGKYYIMALDTSGDHKLDISGSYNNSGWEDFYGICSDIWENNGPGTYYWLGVYNFSNEGRPEIVTGEKQIQQLLHKLYCSTLDKNFSPDSLTSEEKEKLAQAIECGLILKNNDFYKPNFVIFTNDQLEKLQNEIYAPLLSMMEPEFEKLAKQFGKTHKKDFPRAKQGNIDHHTYIDLWMFGIFTLMFAAEENKLYMPKNATDGAPLTLVLVS